MRKTDKQLTTFCFYVILLCELTLANTSGSEAIEKMLTAMSSALDGQALKATVVRTHYKSCPIDKFDSGFTPTVRRTSISEILVDGDRVLETVVDDRKTLLHTKQNSYTYSNNSQQIKVYDPKNQRGTIRKIPSSAKDYLLQTVSSFASLESGRILARGNVDISRLKNVIIRSERTEGSESNAKLVIKGEYLDASPYKTFEIAILPNRNYSISSFLEYSNDGNVLTKIESTGFQKNGDIWTPTSTVCLKYNYDFESGNTVSMSMLDILEPKVAPVLNHNFKFIFPAGTKIYDTSSGMKISTFIDAADDASTAILSDLESLDITTNSSQEIATMAKEKVKSRKIPAESNSIKNKHLVRHINQSTIQYPTSRIKKVAVVLIVCVFAILLCTVLVKLKKGGPKMKIK